jgi:hypothetical protein
MIYRSQAYLGTYARSYTILLTCLAQELTVKNLSTVRGMRQRYNNKSGYSIGTSLKEQPCCNATANSRRRKRRTHGTWPSTSNGSSFGHRKPKCHPPSTNFPFPHCANRNVTAKPLLVGVQWCQPGRTDAGQSGGMTNTMTDEQKECCTCRKMQPYVKGSLQYR